jgi:hypothetical protein
MLTANLMGAICKPTVIPCSLSIARAADAAPFSKVEEGSEDDCRIPCALERGAQREDERARRADTEEAHRGAAGAGGDRPEIFLIQQVDDVQLRS